MSVYLRKGRGWKFDFTINGRRYTSSYFKTKAEAKRAEAVKKEEIRNPAPKTADQETETDMAFLELINRRLDFVKAYNSESHYEKYVQLARRWVAEWDGLRCGQLGQVDVERFVMKRAKVSA